ncbi:MAG TPA: sigma-70 family RNA polymerase sigma factor [Gaiellaceae bacterium]
MGRPRYVRRRPPAERRERWRRPADRALERRLLRAAKGGDRRARQRLVELHMGLVRNVASRYRDLGLPLDDLVQEGAIGLLAAIDRFDPDRGASFSTYARWCVRRAVTHALTDHGRLVRLPKGVVERHRAVAQASARFRAETGREPTREELAAATGLPLPVVAEAAAAREGIASLDEPLSESGPALESLVEDPAAPRPEVEALAHERSELVAGAVQKLPPRQRRVIEAYFGLAGDERSLVELAEELALSPQRARALEQDALRRLWTELEPRSRDGR